jgi:glycosyltransferase involved in cell wall biosynthesis
MKVALVHDHLAQDGGAEQVLRVIARMFPEAPIYTLLAEPGIAKIFPNHVETSIIQHLPGGLKHYQWYMPFMPMAVEFFDLSGYDVVLSDASAFAKGVITGIDTLHICYCHTPTRYVWDYTHQYIKELPYNKYLKKIISLVLNYIRIWDAQAANRVDFFIANSKTVQKRIKKYYKRDSIVIYPPVEVTKYSVRNAPGAYFLIGGRLAKYKKVDIVVEAFRELGLPLKVFGSGVDLPRLREIAQGAPHIQFLERVSEDEKIKLFENCKAFLNPQEEDFGITVVEAMAAGRPVIAYGKGGATETLEEGVSGVFFNEQSAAAIKEAVARFNTLSFNQNLIRSKAEQYSVENFKKNMTEAVEEFRKQFSS